MTTIVTSPFPAFQNLPIHANFYNPNFFQISGITRGLTTLFETSIPHNFFIGQEVRFIIPARYGTTELSGKTGIVVSIPSSDEFIVRIESTSFTPFIPSPYLATITGVSKGANASITANNSFRINDLVKFSDVTGMTEINGRTANVVTAFPTFFTVNISSSSFTTYISGGEAEFFPTYPLPYVLAIGDVNSGAINMDNSSQQLYINGSFINVSPE